MLQTYEISDISSVLEIVQELHEQHRDLLWWRGQARDWPLVPKVHRLDDRSRSYERNVANQFRRFAPSRSPDSPDAGDHARWLFLMQHFGAPTRLLDWTESPLVGLYFAVAARQHREHDGVLWMLDPFSMNQLFHARSGLFLPGYDAVKPLFSRVFSDESGDETVAAVVPVEMHSRMMLQLSGFTIHDSGTPLEELDDLSPFLCKITVTNEAKSRIFTSLSQLGIKRRNLFPDLDNLAKELRNTRFPDFDDPGDVVP